MKKHIGSIVKRGKYYHWRYRDLNGRSKSKVIKNESGGKVVDRTEAEQIAAVWAKELFSLQQLKSKEQVIRHIAEVKSILQTCKEPIEKIEEAYFDHPSAPEVSMSHRKNYHSLLQLFIRFAVKYNISMISDVNEDIAQAFLSYDWKRGISAKTYNTHLDVLKRVFRLLCKDNNPFADFKKKPGMAESRQAFTMEQLQKLWEVLQSPDFHMLHKEDTFLVRETTSLS